MERAARANERHPKQPIVEMTPAATMDCQNSSALPRRTRRGRGKAQRFFMRICTAKARRSLMGAALSAAMALRAVTIKRSLSDEV